MDDLPSTDDPRIDRESDREFRFSPNRRDDPATEASESPEWPFGLPSGGDATPSGEEERTARMGMQARPDVDVAEHPQEVHVWVDLPGCEEDTIELSGDDWTLYVTAERSDEFWEGGGIQRRERARHAERSVSFPARSVVDEAEATFENGVLLVRVPKHESAKRQSIGFE